MAALEKIRLWKELSVSSESLEHSCTDLSQRDEVKDRDLYIEETKSMIHHFREAFALLFLLRRESKLMEGLIDHDFIDRFASINLHLDLLSRNPSDERLATVCDSIWVFSQVVKSLIFWVDHEIANLERTILDAYISQVRAALSRSFPHIELAAVINDQNLPVMIHKGMLTNIIMNMIVNAIKHGKADRIELISSKRDQHNAEMTVQDNGSGIAIPYKDIVHGLGLLHLHKRLEIMSASVEVEEHGGINGGAAFKLLFPLAYEGPEFVGVKIEEPPES